MFDDSYNNSNNKSRNHKLQDQNTIPEHQIN